MIHKTKRHLAIIGGCILLSIGLMISCHKKENTTNKIYISKINNTDTNFYSAVCKVLNAKGISKTDDYINKQIVFDTKKYRYTIWCTQPNIEDPIFSVCKRPIEVDSLESWVVNIKTKEIVFFINTKKEMLLDKEYFNDITKLTLEKNKVKELEEYFNKAQSECIQEILKRL